jgi:hypothetical protein
MTAGPGLRSAVTGLLGLAATEERMLLTHVPAGEPGTPQCWAALPVLAHNAEFKDQQVQRLRAIGRGGTPPDFAEIDHSSAEVYRGYAALSPGEVAARCSRVSGELIDALGSVSDEDLTDPSRHPWLRGRQLWLQVVVRGFWHPMGHLGDYYLAHSQQDRAVALAMHAAATAGYLGVPDPARGMAGYTLACAQAQVGQPDQAAATLGEAIRLNPDLRANAARDPDLAVIRDRGLLQDLLVTR